MHENLKRNAEIEGETNADDADRRREVLSQPKAAAAVVRAARCVHWLVQVGRSGAPACCSSCSSACGCEGDASLCLQVPVPVPVPDTQRVLS